jgi:pimeloyl-ACP methyl ester carboxylesterase
MRRARIPLVLTLLFSLQAATAKADDTRLTPGGHEIDLGDVRLRHVVRGQGPLLFVTSPGWGVGSNYLQLGLAPLEQSMTLVYIDTRGSGGSGRPADRGQMSQAVMADDIDRLREALGLDRIDLFGHSDGGTIAIEYAVRYPQRLRKMVLVAPAVLGDREDDATNGYLKLWGEDPQYQAAVREVIDSNWGPDLTDEAFQHSLLRMMPLYVSDPSRYLAASMKTLETTHLSAYALMAQDEAANRAARDQTRDAATIRAQTLILNGTVDWICPYPAAQRLHAAIPDSELRLYANKGHLLWIEDESRFFDDVRRFMEHAAAP